MVNVFKSLPAFMLRNYDLHHISSAIVYMVVNSHFHIEIETSFCSVFLYWQLVRKEAVFTCKVRWLSDEVKEPPIPDWEKPKNESAELTKARLVYQSRKRGMSENGLILRWGQILKFTCLQNFAFSSLWQILSWSHFVWDISSIL